MRVVRLLLHLAAGNAQVHAVGRHHVVAAVRRRVVRRLVFAHEREGDARRDPGRASAVSLPGRCGASCVRTSGVSVGGLVWVGEGLAVWGREGSYFADGLRHCGGGRAVTGVCGNL